MHIPEDRPSSRVHVHLCLPDSKLEPPPSGATFGEYCLPDGKCKPPPNGAIFREDSDAGSVCNEGGAEQIVNPRAREKRRLVRCNKYLSPRARGEPGPVRGKGTDKKKVAQRVGGKGTGKKKVTRSVGGNGTAAGKKKKAGP